MPGLRPERPEDRVGGSTEKRSRPERQMMVVTQVLLGKAKSDWQNDTPAVKVSEQKKKIEKASVKRFKKIAFQKK